MRTGKGMVWLGLAVLAGAFAIGQADRGVGARAGAGGTRVALVVGNGAYAGAPLKNPANDARDVAEALKRLGFEVLGPCLDQSAEQMEESIQAFGRRLAAPGAAGVFYYAGHGVQANGRNYLVPVGVEIATESQLKYRAVDVGMVLDEMAGARNPVNLVILDACRDNPFSRGFRSAAHGLAVMDAPTGTVIAYATAPGSTAADGEGRNGVYTKNLVRRCRSLGCGWRRCSSGRRRGCSGRRGGGRCRGRPPRSWGTST